MKYSWQSAMLSCSKVAKCYVDGTRAQLVNRDIKNDFRSDALEMAIFWKIKMWKYAVWLAPGARNGAQQHKTCSWSSLVYRVPIRFSSKTNDVTPTGCTRSDTTTSTIILKSERIGSNNNSHYAILGRSVLGLCAFTERGTSPNSWGELVRNYLRLLPIPSYPALLL